MVINNRLLSLYNKIDMMNAICTKIYIYILHLTEILFVMSIKEESIKMVNFLIIIKKIKKD